MALEGQSDKMVTTASKLGKMNSGFCWVTIFPVRGRVDCPPPSFPSALVVPALAGFRREAIIIHLIAHQSQSSSFPRHSALAHHEFHRPALAPLSPPRASPQRISLFFCLHTHHCILGYPRYVASIFLGSVMRPSDGGHRTRTSNTRIPLTFLQSSRLVHGACPRRKSGQPSKLSCISFDT